MLYSNGGQQPNGSSTRSSINKLGEDLLRDTTNHLNLASHPLKQQLQLQTPANYATMQYPNNHSQQHPRLQQQHHLIDGSSQPMHFANSHHNLQQQQPHVNTMHFQQASNNTMHFQHSPSSQTMHFPHHTTTTTANHTNLQSNLNNHSSSHLTNHANQQQQQQQQQYNMNSDYSSSTYHIYDQISDLIIVKQQRLERKRELDRRRKVIYITLGATILVGSLLFLILQSLLTTSQQSAASSGSALLQRANGVADQSIDTLLMRDSAQGIFDQSQVPKQIVQQQQQPLPVALDNGASGVNKLVMIPATANNNRQQQQDLSLLAAFCSNHGQLVISTPLPSPIIESNIYQQQQQPQQQMCKCDPGFWGERCEFGSGSSATYQQANQLLARCLLQTNYCSGRGQCNNLGRCQCQPGFAGPQCEYRATSEPSVVAIKPFGVDAGSPISAGNRPTDQCPQNCNEHGQCLSGGRCRCFAGFAGEFCQEQDLCHEQSCSKQGTCDPQTGMCQCRFGFVGLQCETRDDLAWRRLANCSSHGKFDAKLEKCLCDQGFGGLDCSEERCDSDVAQLDCGPNGLFDCRQGKCLCQDGYSGAQCQVPQCSPQCLRNGQCGSAGQCICQPGYYGKHCSFNGCPNQCSGRGQCLRVAEAVTANQQQKQGNHQMQAEWKCQCQAGSMGDDCGLLVERQCDDGIDNDRDGLVDCADSECCGDKVCQNSTLCMKLPDPLDILMRKQPPPPTSSFFQRMQFLIEKASSQMYSQIKDFNDSIMVSRYVDRASVIRGRVTYLKQGVTGVRVSVAGQLNLGMTLTRDGGYFDLMVNGGGAVLIEFRREPFATQKKAVRVPWNEIVLMDPIELALESNAALNQPEDQQLMMNLPALGVQQQDSPSCLAHNYRLMRPVIVAAPKSSRKSHSRARSQQQTSRAVILRDSGMVQQSISLPASSMILPTSSNSQQHSDESNQSVSLVYISSRANEFMSTVSLQLTPPMHSLDFKLPQELKLIHLKIVIEGNLFEQVFEPQANLSYTYAWNRRNVYRQKSFGLSTASVSVGYEYFDCQHIVWSSKNIQLAGHDLSISDIGNQWNLNIHHRYNYRDSILQRGDGQNFNLKTDKPRVVQPILGDGYQRQVLCTYCDGATTGSAANTEQRLLKPQALVSSPDGSLIVGDSNWIRKVERGSNNQQRLVRTLLELPANRVPTRYSLALSLIDSKLFMGDTDHFQIYQIKEQESLPTSNDTAAVVLEENMITVVGSGIKCQQAEDLRNNCGDGQSALAARLIEPKAMAFDLANRMYIADGPNVRMVDPQDNKIYTILGDYGATRHTKFPCSAGEAIPMHKFVPNNPLDLAVSPIDDTLHILDDNVVYKITKDKRVQIVAGRLAHCLSSTVSKQQQAPKATEVFLQSAQSIAFNQNGDLFIGEDDQKQMLSRVLMVVPDEDSIALYAGLPIEQTTLKQQPTVDIAHLSSDSDMEQRSSNALPMLNQQATKAIDYKFNSVASIAVDQQGNLIVADKIQLRVLSIEPDLPQLNQAGEYEIQSPDNGDELLVFNRHGHHVATRDISSGQVAHSARSSGNKFTFYYNVNTALGQLASISYASGNKITIYRDGPHHGVKLIETAFGGQCKLDISRHGQVHSISIMAPNASKTSFSYHVDGGLLKQSRDQANGELFDFTYDEFGRASSIQHSSSKFSSPVECTRSISAINNFSMQRYFFSKLPVTPVNNYTNQLCSQLIVAE